MAQSVPAAQMSPPAMSHGIGRADRDGTPPPQPQSKRDKRRNMLSEKLAEIRTSFGVNRKQHYDEQLRALEIDMNLIMRADPYAEQPLEDGGEEVADMISVMTGGSSADEPVSNLTSLAGKYYTQFADDINSAMEYRDRDLTMTYNYYHNGIEELHRTNQYKIQLAQEEHVLLCKTLRDRLISSVGHKRARLLREKEQLDIADSNALLLNPNQFSIANPVSPGGTQIPRKTRNTRHRPGDPEDLVGTASATDGNNKRKRKVPAEDNENGSPAPIFRIPDNGSSTPLRDAKSKTIYSQYETPLYSIDRLFTEKELAMTMNRAHLAANEFFARARAQEENKGVGTEGTGTNGASKDHDIREPHEVNAASAMLGLQVEADVDSDVPATFAPASPEPGYLQPQTHHATRSSRNTGLNDLASAAAAIPPYAVNISSAASKANPSAQMPAALTDQEIRADMALMGRKPDDPIYEVLLEKACEKPGLLGPSRGPLASGEWSADGAFRDYTASNISGNGSAMGLEFEAPGPRLVSSAMARASSALGLGGVPMSKQSSMGGMSELGGTSMQRSMSAADFGAAGAARGKLR